MHFLSGAARGRCSFTAELLSEAVLSWLISSLQQAAGRKEEEGRGRLTKTPLGSVTERLDVTERLLECYCETLGCHFGEIWKMLHPAGMMI